MKEKIAVAAFLFLLPQCSHKSKMSPARAPNQYGAVHSELENDPSKNLSFDQLKNLIVSKKISSVEQTLAELSRTHSGYLQFHTLMYASQSLHESSFSEPRAIVFGPTAKFVITFNGGSHQRGGNALEVMEFNDSSKTFEFREIAFKSTKTQSADLELTPEEIAFENKKVVISKPNPGKCLACHGPNANPIWMSYFLWPGAYGSNDDHLHMSFDRSSWNANNQDFFKKADRPHSQGRAMVLADPNRDPEVEGYIKYLRNRSQHPRYRFLPKTFHEDSFLKYAAGQGFAELDRSDVANVASQEAQSTYAWPSRPNLYFQAALIEKNQERILKVLKEKHLGDQLLSLREMRFYEKVFGATQASDPLDHVSGVIHSALKLASPEIHWDRQSIRARFEKNLKDEMLDLIEKVYLHEQALKPARLKVHTLDDGYNSREWMGSLEAFYSPLLRKKEFGEKERIVFQLESADLALYTMVELFLETHGVDLTSFNMNFRQQSPNFHSGGLSRVYEFLGLTQYN